VRYRVVAVGKLREPFYRTACAHYLARLRALTPCEVIEVREGRGAPDAVKRAEGQALLIAADGHVIALDEGGATLTTRQFAERIGQLELAGTSRVTLLIGGAEGHDDATRAAVNETMSLSRLTFPHDLARLVLLEQLYRIETVRAGHPYHRD
jgi:23S rRNA (pseudouridine1915-N3)-methyltransferase